MPCVLLREWLLLAGRFVAGLSKGAIQSSVLQIALNFVFSGGLFFLQFNHYFSSRLKYPFIKKKAVTGSQSQFD